MAIGPAMMVLVGSNPRRPFPGRHQGRSVVIRFA